MAKFRRDDDILIYDQHGDITYDDAVNATVDSCVDSIEEALWNLVDDLEYIIGEEAHDPEDVTTTDTEEEE